MTSPTPDGAITVNAALAAAVAGNDETGVVQALAGQELVLPQTTEVPADPSGQREVTLPVIEQDGGSFVPAFTSAELMAQALPDTPSSIVVDASELAGVWPSSDLTLLVNPGDTETAVALPASAMPALAVAQKTD
ncbi:MAG TPA: SseB family protein [Mycobacteriales bacterium]|jgi:hypothetical protein|nr:SseB family protein [Mycobacteriales bacterium]